MTVKRAVKIRLIQVGKHLINPADVACISRVRKNLYVVKRLSEPNADFPIWITRESDLDLLLKEFEIVAADVTQREEDDAPFMDRGQ